MELPKRYESKESEKKWKESWEKEKIYKFNPKSKNKIYSVDTPPPTVSGKMHIGHSFSYAQQDFIARYRRMKGFNVFYPFGTDDNGLPTERLVERTKKVKSTKMERKEFVDLCLETVNELKPEFVKPWKDLAVSCDFEDSYSTIDAHCQKASQMSFVNLYEKGRIFQEESPVTWCPTCQTAIAQAEFENVEMTSHFNEIIFKCGGKDLVIVTTRPELIPACVALFVHPDDKRYNGMVGKFAKVPLFNYEVPIMEDESVDIEKGTGLMMVCTFGDKEDIEKWRKYKLPLKVNLNTDGTLNDEAGKYSGLKIKDARKQIIEDLKGEGLLINQKDISHAINLHERCATEVEFLKTKQWFIKVLDKKQDLIKAADKISWYPSHMKARYVHWVENLNWDWCISRQRHYGVPIPVWYCKKCGKIILAKEENLPVDPLRDKPKGKCDCGSNDFTPETDVLDTWATSSLTPQIVLNKVKDKEYFEKSFPMSLRPQAHDIIRTWAFYTIVKAVYEDNDVPWNDIVISGHALDPKGRKMSKSRGNVVDPLKTMDEYGTDALRFWAATSKLGEDLPFQEKDLVTGKKFITKLWNASKFAIIHLEDYKLEKPKNLEAIDKWILSRVSEIIKNSTESFDKYEYSRTKADVENFFWHEFCDNYLEIVKDRLYNPDKRGKDSRLSAQYGLYNTLLAILKMMAPIMPFITEEIYQLYFAKHDKSKSIHVSSWPEPIKKDEKAEKVGELAIYAVQKARQAKSEQNLSLKSPLKNLFITGKISKEEFELVKEDIIASTNAEKIGYEKLDEKSEIDYEAEIEL
ncbi:MAG: valine--tRNA ligase [Nanoarchaeota archaeon]|nr:valine--tRNA ligase [Nanoarchaeota archaeon]